MTTDPICACSANDPESFILHTDAYIELVLKARSFAPTYRFTEVPVSGPALIWRHDCDMSLERAFDVAVIDAEYLGVSTFFVHLHSEFYNILEAGQRDLVRGISALGHDVGLHFDPSFYRNSTQQELEENIGWEAQALERQLDVKLTAVSFHNPTVMQSEFRASHYSGLVNASGPIFQNSISYCSDSNGRWNYENGFEVLQGKQLDRLQMLTHPEWWVTHHKPARSKVFDIAFGRARRVLDNYDDLLRANERVNDAGSAAEVIAARNLLKEEYDLLDYLWARREFRLVEKVLLNLGSLTAPSSNEAQNTSPEGFRSRGLKSHVQHLEPALRNPIEGLSRLSIEERCLVLLREFVATANRHGDNLMGGENEIN